MTALAWWRIRLAWAALPGLMAALGAVLIVATLLLGPAGPAAAAEGIDVREAHLESHEDGLNLVATFDFDLTPRLEEAVSRGLPLYFVVEFEITRSRWYWFDDKAATAMQTYRLSYNALTRQYRLATGPLQQGFPTLAEALGVMTRVRNWRVADRGVVKPGETYQASVRMRLDVSQLPKPFQINAITDRDWRMESDWKRFAVTAEGSK